MIRRPHRQCIAGQLLDPLIACPRATGQVHRRKDLFNNIHHMRRSTSNSLYRCDHKLFKDTSRWCRAMSRQQVIMMNAAKVGVALDFDGVICDSSKESSISAWNASKQYWPDLFPSDQSEIRDRVVEDTRQVRPIVETGYENVLLARTLFENRASVNEILDDWDTLRPQLMEMWNLDRTELVTCFASIRDQWIEEDPDSWVAENEIYPGVAEALKSILQNEAAEVYIVTTKQTRYVLRILQEKAGVEFPEERIISSTVSGIPKSTTLLKLMDKHEDVGAWHFVEDRYKTLEGICDKQKKDSKEAAALSTIQLYLVDWGFNVQRERDAASKVENIEVIAIEKFCNRLKDGFK